MWMAVKKKMSRTFTCVLSVILLIILMYKFCYQDVVRVENFKFESQVNNLKLLPLESYSFKMDSVTDGSGIEYVEIYTDVCGEEYLTFLNRNTNSIYYYNLDKTTYSHKVDLETIGFNTEENIQAYRILNEDTIFCYSYSSAKFKIVNPNIGKLLSKTLSSKLDNMQGSVYPYVSTSAPIFFDKKDRKVYLTGFTSQEIGSSEYDGSRKILAVFSLNNAKVSYNLKYPSYYWGVNWGGGGGLRQPYMDMVNGHIYVSFMASHNIEIFDKNFNYLGSKYLGSSRIKETRSMRYSNNIHEFISSGSIYNYYLSTPSYKMIKFDRYRNLWYRIAETEEIVVKNNIRMKKKVLIVADVNWNIIGESEIPIGEYNVDQLMISKKGILLKSESTNGDKFVMTSLGFSQ